MKTYILKSFFKGTFFDFVLQDEKADAVIILPGFPSNNDFSDLIKFFYEKGYHVFVPRYRGSYQSKGVFLSKNPIYDLEEFLTALEKGVARSLWDGKKKKFIIRRKILLAGSFGGAIGCGLAAKTQKFTHVILTSPVWDFEKHNSLGDEQDLVKLTQFVKRAYNNCYNYDFDSIAEAIGKFIETKPDYYLPLLETTPVLIMHDPNDKTVAIKHSKEMFPLLKKAMFIEHYFGHVSSDDLFVAHWKDVEKFININYVQ